MCVEPNTREGLRYVTDPEQLWELEGHPAWTAPYVWETNY